MKKISIVAGILVFVFIAVLCVCLGRINFDADEAKEAMGETYDLSDGWTITLSDGTRETISLPYTVPASKASKVALQHEFSEDYANLTLSFYAENVALKVMAGGNKIFQEGYSDSERGLFGRWNKIENVNNGAAVSGGAIDVRQSVSPRGINGRPDQDEIPEFINNDISSSSKTEAGAVLIDFPDSLSEKMFEIDMEQVNGGQDIVIHSASVAKRDITIISMLRKNMFPIICLVLIFIALAILVMMDVFRTVTHRRTRGLAYMILFGLLLSIYSFIQNDLLIVFFENQKFFAVIEHICFVVMPIFLVLFFKRGFSRLYPGCLAVLLWLAVLMAVAELSVDFFLGIQLNRMSDYTFIVQVIIIGVIVHMLILWKRQKESRVIWMDLSALGCLVVSLAINPIRNRVSGTYSFDILRMAASTLCFLFITLEHTYIMLNEFKKRVKRDEEKLEEQIQIAEEARREAVVANEAKGRFLANMSHEIRTPINAVLGMDEMILRESREKEIRNYAMDIYTAGQTLLSLINDILDLSKIESGKMEIVPVDYDVCSMIHDLVNMISQRARAKDLRFEVSVAKDLPARLFGDDVRIRQVLTNILTNAVKYTQSGTVWLRISGKREGEYEILHCEVEDTGIGIKEEDLPKLFEEFRRIEENRNRNIEGTGLGMSITVQMLALMDSHLEVDSVYGKGTKFFFDLRQKIMDGTPVGDFESRLQNLSENYHYTRAFCAPDAKILVVDDNRTNRKVFAGLLKATQIQVTEAESGAECLQLVAKQHFDIIFLDHMMPDMDGVETLHHMKEMNDYPCEDTPVYVLTANAVTGAREQYLAEGFDGFLSKPIISGKLEQAIRDTLPEELLLPVEEADSDSAENEPGTTAVPEDLTEVDGVDWNYAWLHLPDRELLETTVKEFYDILSLHAKRLEQMYSELPSEGALDSYRIQVHAMKSTAGTIGIIPLSGMAKVLEHAARDKDLEKIHSLHSTFIAEWLSYEEKLYGVFGLGKEMQEGKPDYDEDTLKSFLEIVRLHMENFDVDGADAVMEQIKQFHYPEEIQKKIQELQAAVTDLDVEGAAAVIDGLD